MPRDFRFRVSLYLTLAAASLCLAAAEQALLPGIFGFAAPVVGLLLVALLVEGRWVLPVWATNLVGLVIAAGWGVWIDQMLFNQADPWRDYIPLHAAALPGIGPLLMLLVVVRLFRPKQRRDVWALQGLGLLQVGLGCVLGYTPAFGGFLFVYLVCALASLALFELCGGTEGGGAAQGALRPEAGATPIRPVRWAVGVMTVALLLCLVLPRGGAEAWNPLRLVAPGSRPGAGLVQTGVPDQIDLNRTGSIDIDDEVVMTVSAKDGAEWAKLDLSPSQRWRGPILDRYRDGRWEGGLLQPLMQGPGDPGPIEDPPEPGAARRRLFDLGPQQYFLNYELDLRKAGGVFLAEPIVLHAPGQEGDAACVLATARSRSSGLTLFQEFEGTLVPAARVRVGTVKYRQVTVPPEEPDLSPPADIQDLYLNNLKLQPVAALTTWTRQLAERLASRPESGIALADLELRATTNPKLWADHPAGILPQVQWEKVARALAGHLAHSGEYTYSLDLRRQDWDVDPTLDFLANVKAGHCDRYAGGLALMLRSLGIPARVVLGFHGADNHGDGTYEIRNSMAHAWVEVPVLRPGPNGDMEWHWLQLDPTPEGGAAPRPWYAVGRWWEKGQNLGQLVWRSFVVDYTAEQQEQLWNGVGDSLQLSGGGLPAAGWLLALGLVPVALAGIWLGRHVRFGRRRRPRGPASPVAFYRRLLDILARRRGLRPVPSETPREFAVAARPILPADLASLPAEAAELLYRVRYGGEPLPVAEGRTMDRRLAQLDAALAGR